MTKYEDPLRRRNYLYQKILGLVYEFFNRQDVRGKHFTVCLDAVHEALQEDHPDLDMNESREVVHQLFKRGSLEKEYVKQGGNVCFKMTPLGEDEIAAVIEQERDDLIKFAYIRSSISPSSGFTLAEANVKLDGVIEVKHLIAREVTLGNLEVISSQQDQEIYRMTEAAFEGLKNGDMTTLNISASGVFIIEAEDNDIGLDNKLWERCSIALASGTEDVKVWDMALRSACVVLEERLKEAANITSRDKTAEDAVNSLFGGSGKLAAKCSNKSEAVVYRNLYSGVMGFLRNNSAHTFTDPSPLQGRAAILFIDLLLKELDNLQERPAAQTN